MIKPFNVLERTQQIHSSYLLEASAGTGKTYSIENIVVRLLIDKTFPSTLDNILVVTFTKASTSDLKERIRKNIYKTLAILTHKSEEDPPDYLKALLEAEYKNQLYATQQLEQALACFEQAPIFTIHGFCHRMLKEYLFEADVGAALGEREEGISTSFLCRLIRDFFRIEMTEKLVSLEQIQCVLKHTGSVEKLEKELQHLITRGIAIAPQPCIQELFNKFCSDMCELKQFVKVTNVQILEDFERQAPLYKDICNKQKKPKEENIAKVTRFAALLSKTDWNLADFDVLIADGVYMAEVLQPTNLCSKKLPLSPEQLHCPELVDHLNRLLVPTVTAARNPYFILSVLACRCKKMVQSYMEKNEIFGFDDLLMGMYKAVQHDELASKIRQRFTTAIIDEFQDTDPIQWEIFQKIFLPKNQPHARLYLVGDPKQSIYGFRQADIYTYLSAGDALGNEFKASLDTNYRSTHSLVEALNTLFSAETVPKLMALPRLNQTLPYVPVKSGAQATLQKFKDGRGALHFFSFEEPANNNSKKFVDGEESYFIPFIADELLHLQSQGIALNDCAVLVADRFQATRLMHHLKTKSIPTVAQHSENISSTVAFAATQELLQAVLTPQRESALKLALAGPLLGWTQQEVAALDDPLHLEFLIAKGMALRKIWFQKGFSAFFQALLESSWLPMGIGGKAEINAFHPLSIAENLLSSEGGLSLYHCIQQIAELLIEYEIDGKLSPYKLVDAFDDIRQLEKIGDQQIKQRANPEKEGVRILTIHSSKGLEFEVVFALGVIKRSKVPSHFVPISYNGALPLLTAIADCHDPRYVQYALELDAEKIRQLYVAFTRAKQRLYAPLVFQSSSKDCERGTASPIEIYLTMMGKPEIIFENLYESIPHLNAESALTFIRTLGKHRDITLSTPQEKPLQERSSPHNTTEIHLLPPPNATIMGTPSFMHSFTALSAAGKEEESTPTLDKNVLIELHPPSDFENTDRTAHTLPAGSSTGIMLHTLMEFIPFAIATRGELDLDLYNFVGKFLKSTPYETWHTVIANIVFKALSTPLVIGESIIYLKDLQEGHCYREHAFVYSEIQDIHPELAIKSGFLQGVIDLTFEHEGKYCILDWKSNWLGPDESFYTQEQMKRAMHAHNYFLQAEIYKEALKRYLKLVDDRPFEELFGGIFYVFMRGLEGNNGVFKF